MQDELPERLLWSFLVGSFGLSQEPTGSTVAEAAPPFSRGRALIHSQSGVGAEEKKGGFVWDNLLRFKC